jgi:penicillin-binding protein 1A
MAGKTGTTNDYIDAWFCGYQPTVVGIAWIGFDQPKRMGSGETGGTAALPIWIGYMQTALKGVPESYMDVPEGLAAINAADPSGKVQKELIYKEQLPPEEAPDPSEPLPTTGPAPAPAPVSDAKPKAVTR